MIKTRFLLCRLALNRSMNNVISTFDQRVGRHLSNFTTRRREIRFQWDGWKKSKNAKIPNFHIFSHTLPRDQNLAGGGYRPNFEPLILRSDNFNLFFEDIRGQKSRLRSFLTIFLHIFPILTHYNYSFPMFLHFFSWSPQDFLLFFKPRAFPNIFFHVKVWIFTISKIFLHLNACAMSSVLAV